MGRPISSATHYDCGHERTLANTIIRKDTGYRRCRTCKNAEVARYYAAHKAYYEAYRIAHKEAHAVYMRAWRKGVPRPGIARPTRIREGELGNAN